MKFHSIKSITIYCSSSNKISKRYKKLAYNLGLYLAKNNINLVYGGGSNGLMGEISKSVRFWRALAPLLPIRFGPNFVSEKFNLPFGPKTSRLRIEFG